MTDIKQAYRRYAEIKAQVALLESEAATISEQLKQDILDNNNEAVKTNVGLFSLMTRRTWRYSETTQELESTLSAAQKAERDSGVAEVSKETVSLVYRMPRE